MTAVGIDLGTSKSCVAVWRDGSVHVIANEQGTRTTPSCVTFNERERLFGNLALTHLSKYPSRTVYDSKRLLGQAFEDVQNNAKFWPFKVKNEDFKPKVVVEYKQESRMFAPEEISAMVLTKMKQVAETFLGEVVNAVITVPASFNDRQRQATLDAGKIAGLNVLRIINEPTAAALAYGLDKGITGKHNILVYNLGGGCFDVSVVEIIDGARFTVKATAGNSHLGGDDFDLLLLEYLLSRMSPEQQQAVRNNTRALQKLRTAAERAKVALSSIPVFDVEIDSLVGGEDVRISVHREDFEKICIDKFHTTVIYVKKVIRDAEMTTKDIHQVIMVGGSSRIPKIKSLLEELFSQDKINYSMNMDEAAVYGAAIEAARLSKDVSPKIKNLLVFDVSSEFYGIAGCTDVIFQANSRIPQTVTRAYTKSAHFSQRRKLIRESAHNLINSSHELGKIFSEFPKGDIYIIYSVDINGILKVDSISSGFGKWGKNIKFTYENGSLSYSDMKRCKDNVLKLRQEEELESKRVDALHQLEKFAYSVKIALKSAGASGVEVVRRCDEALKWIEFNEQASTEVILGKLKHIQDQNADLQSKMSRPSSSRCKENVKEVRDNVVESMDQKVLEKFVGECFNEMNNLYGKTVKNKDFNMQQLFDLQSFLEEVKQTLIQRETLERISAKNMLESFTEGAKDEMLQVDLAVRDAACRDFIRLCDECLNNIQNHNGRSKNEFDQELAHMRTEYEKVGRKINIYVKEQAEKARMTARNELKNYVEDVKSQVSEFDRSVRDVVCPDFVQLCMSTLRKINKDQITSKIEFEDELTHMQTEYKNVARKVDTYLKEQAEKSRIATKKELIDFVEHAKTEILEVDKSVRDMICPEFVTVCALTSQKIRKDEIISKKEFEEELTYIRTEYYKVKRKVDNYVMEQAGKKLIVARNELKTFVEEAKNHVLKFDLAFRDAFCQNFIALCVLTGKKIAEEQMTSKKEFEDALTLMRAEYDLVLRDVTLYAKQEAEKALLASRTELQYYIEYFKKHVSDSDPAVRDATCQDFIRTCDLTLQKIHEDQFTSKEEFEYALNSMKKEYETVLLKIIQMEFDANQEKNALTSASNELTNCVEDMEVQISQAGPTARATASQNIGKYCNTTSNKSYNDQISTRNEHVEELANMQAERKRAPLSMKMENETMTSLTRLRIEVDGLKAVLMDVPQCNKNCCWQEFAKFCTDTSCKLDAGQITSKEECEEIIADLRRRNEVWEKELNRITALTLPQGYRQENLREEEMVIRDIRNDICDYIKNIFQSGVLQSKHTDCENFITHCNLVNKDLHENPSGNNKKEALLGILRDLKIQFEECKKRIH